MVEFPHATQQATSKLLLTYTIILKHSVVYFQKRVTFLSASVACCFALLPALPNDAATLVFAEGLSAPGASSVERRLTMLEIDVFTPLPRVLAARKGTAAAAFATGLGAA